MRQHINSRNGFTLIELMVAMAIGMIIMLAVGALFISSRQTTGTQMAFARVQESGRFGIEWLSTYTRNAGARATILSDTSVVFPAATPFTNHSYPSSAIIFGRDLATGDEYSVRMEGSLDRPVMDCNGVLIPNASSPVGTSMLALRFYRSGNQVLCDSTVSGPAQVIAENVVDMQMVYGQDTKAVSDGYPTRYVSAANVTSGGASWANVVSMRMCLTVASQATNVVLTPQTYETCSSAVAQNPTMTTATDYRLYKNFMILVNLRNAGAS